MSIPETTSCSSSWRDEDPFGESTDCGLKSLAIDVPAVINLIAGVFSILIFLRITVLLVCLERDHRKRSKSWNRTPALSSALFSVSFGLNHIVVYFVAETTSQNPSRKKALLTANAIFIVPYIASWACFFLDDYMKSQTRVLSLHFRKQQKFLAQARSIAPWFLCSCWLPAAGLLGVANATDSGQRQFFGSLVCISIVLSGAAIVYIFALLRNVMMWGNLPKSAKAFLNEFRGWRLYYFRVYFFAVLLYILCAASLAFCSLVPVFVPRMAGAAFYLLQACILPVTLAANVSMAAFAVQNSHDQRLTNLRKNSAHMAALRWNSSRRLVITPVADDEPLEPKARRKVSLRSQFATTSEAAHAASESLPTRARGMSLAFLVQFIEEMSIGDEDSSQDVQERLILSETEKFKCSYFALVHECLNDETKEGQAEPMTGKQNVFVSHSWRTPFKSLVATIAHFEAVHSEKNKSKTCQFFYYIDIFVLNQWELRQKLQAENLVNSVLLTELDDCIRETDTLLVAINRWDKPEPLSRIWCLYELWRGIEKGKRIKMGFPELEEARFAAAARMGEANVEEIVETKVDVNNALATDESDIHIIMRKIRSAIGVEKFNARLRVNLMAHLVRYCIADGTKGTKKSYKCSSPEQITSRRLAIPPSDPSLGPFV